MSQGENPLIDGVDDRGEFLATQDAFRLLGFSEKEQNNIFRILAGILQLGNIVIESGMNCQQMRYLIMFELRLKGHFTAQNN